MQLIYIDDIKKLPFDSMFNLMKEHHKKLNDLINLRPQSRENRGKRFEVIVHAGNIYIKLYNIYRCKYYKKKKKFECKN